MASVAKRKWASPNGEKKEGWEVRYSDPTTGKRPSKTFALKKEADAFKRKVEREIEDGVHVTASATRPFGEVVSDYLAGLERREREGTLRAATYKKEESHLRVHLLPRFATRMIADLVEADASALINDLRDGKLGTASVGGILKTFGRVLEFAKRRGWVKRNVFREVRSWPEHRLPPAERIRTFDRDQAREVYEYFVDPRARNATWSRPYAAMGRALVFLAMFVGVRSGEARGLTWGAVDFTAGTIRIDQQLDHRAIVSPTKTAASVRTVPVPAVVLDALRAYQPYAKANDADLIFTRRSGRPLSYTALHNEIWKRALVDLGYTAADVGGWPHFHALRHFASSMMVNHMPIGDVGPLLGHRDFDTTLRVYTGAILTAPARRAAVESMATALLLPAG